MTPADRSTGERHPLRAGHASVGQSIRRAAASMLSVVLGMALGTAPTRALAAAPSAQTASAAAMTVSPAAQPVEVPSLDRMGLSPVTLPAFWFRAPVAGRAAAVLLLHGCGGPYADAAPQRLSQRMREYAQWLNAEGLHVLVTDSLTPRGVRELCTQRAGTRAVTIVHRRRDALGALQWLAAQPEVDARRLGVIGWSNGGSTVLAATNARHADVTAASARPAFAVAFYPGCENELARGYRPTVPLLMLLGEADDWTSAAACQELASGSAAPRPEVVTYAGAHHGFDGTAPVRLRRDVPNGVHPGQGVHLGGDPAARAASRERMLQFVRQALAATPAQQ